MGFLVGFVIPVAVLFLVMYFLIIRPQKKQDKKHKEMIETLKKGDKIETKSGIVATIQAIGDDYFIIASEGSKLKVIKAAVASKRG